MKSFLVPLELPEDTQNSSITTRNELCFEVSKHPILLTHKKERLQNASD